MTTVEAPQRVPGSRGGPDRPDEAPAWTVLWDEPPPGWTASESGRRAGADRAARAAAAAPARPVVPGGSVAGPLSEPARPVVRPEADGPSADDLVLSGSEAGPLSEGARRLVEAVRLLAAQVPSELVGAQAVSETALLLERLEALHALVLARVADVDARQLHALDDAPSTATWVARQQTSVDRGEVALARRLGTFPAVAGALRDRRLSVQAGRRIAAALTKVRRLVDRPDGLIDGQPAEETITAVVVDGVLSLVAEARGGLPDDDPLLRSLLDRLVRLAAEPRSEIDRLEDAFVLLAGHVDPVLLPSCLARLVDALLPLAAERRAADAHAERGLTLRRTSDGSGWILSGDLDLECGELLDAVLAAERAVDADNAVDTTAYAMARADGWHPDDELPADGPRSLRQQRHDALRNGLRRYLDAGIAGMRDKVVPHLSVTVSAQALHGVPGALPAVAASGARLPRSLVRAWWCDSAVTRFVLSLGHRVLETSHTARTLKATERRAKHLETGGVCQGAGCARGPGHQLVPHHATPWALTRTTRLDDTVLLCAQTHHDLHSGGRVLRLKDGRRLGPDGWVT